MAVVFCKTLLKSRVINANPDYRFLCSVKKVLCGENVDEEFDLTLSQMCSLKFAPITSCDVERSFSVYKNILTDKRRNLTENNLEMLLVVNCAKKVK